MSSVVMLVAFSMGTLMYMGLVMINENGSFQGRKFGEYRLPDMDSEFKNPFDVHGIAYTMAAFDACEPRDSGSTSLKQ